MSTKTKTKHTRDRGLVSSEPWEVEYIHRQFPNYSHEEVVKALQSCKDELHRSEDRDKVMACLRQKLH